jgi:U3 small nucleolar RNA-associated protein 19
MTGAGEDAHSRTRTHTHTPTHNPSHNTDPYDHGEPDPAKCRALDSCLWEVVGLKTHYLPSIASWARIFEQPLTRQEYDMEDFLDHTYGNLFASWMTPAGSGARSASTTAALACGPAVALVPSPLW